MKTEHILLVIGGFLLWQHMQKQQTPQQVIIREGGGGGGQAEKDEYGWKDAVDDLKDILVIGKEWWDSYNSEPEINWYA